MARRVLKRVTALVAVLSLVLFVTLVAAHVRIRSDADTAQLGIGRGYYTLDLVGRPSDFDVKVTRYATPLKYSHPDAPFFRTRGYGWFVDNVRGGAWPLGPVEFETTQADFEYAHTLFLTDWRPRCSYWLAIPAPLLLPVAWFASRRRARRA